MLSEFRQCLDESGLNYAFRQDSPEKWEETSNELDYQPVSYSGSNIDYQIAYFRNGSDYGRVDIDILDMSIIIYNDNKPCCIWPISISSSEGNNRIHSYGGPVLPPIFTSATTNGTQKRLLKSCFKFIKHVCIVNNISNWESVESFTNQAGLSYWNSILMANSAVSSIQYELYVDLSFCESKIKSLIRKRYRSLITKGEKLWELSIMESANLSVWNEFKLLHAEVSGRVTRSKETWDLQHKAIINGYALLIYIRNETGEMIGAGLFYITNSEGLYAVGAYKREMFDNPMSHVIHYHAILEMKRRKLKWYKIGRRYFPGEMPRPTKKEISIAEFKEGFSTHIYPRINLTLGKI